MNNTNYIKVNFKRVPLGAEFYWGGCTIERSNWGRKRSFRTADWRPRNLSGELEGEATWSFFRQDETVYINSNLIKSK